VGEGKGLVGGAIYGNNFWKEIMEAMYECVAKPVTYI